VHRCNGSGVGGVGGGISGGSSGGCAHLSTLCELQREDLRDLFKAAEGRSVGVKLLDTPLGSFLPYASEVSAHMPIIHLHTYTHFPIYTY
jgi:hypothetical protein